MPEVITLMLKGYWSATYPQFTSITSGQISQTHLYFSHLQMSSVKNFSFLWFSLQMRFLFKAGQSQSFPGTADGSTGQANEITVWLRYHAANRTCVKLFFFACYIKLRVNKETLITILHLHCKFLHWALSPLISSNKI